MEERIPQKYLVKYLVKLNNIYTGGENLTTQLVKYFNDLLDDQSSERSRDEVTFFYVMEVLYVSKSE